MKKNTTFRTVLTLLAIFLLGISQTVAQNYEKTFSFEFLTEYIQIERNGGVDCIIVDDIIYNNSFWGDYGSKPALPYIHYTILLPDDYKVKGFTFSKDDTWTADNIILRPIPSVFPISVSESADDENNPITYPITTYPAEIILIDENISYGYRTAKILINPFTYYAESQKLELATSLSLTVTIEPIDKENTWIPPKKPQEIKRDVYNLEDIDKGLENWTKEANNLLPLFEEGKVWECYGVNQSISPEYRHSYPVTTYTVKGDTIIEDVSYKKLYVKTVYENGDTEEGVYPVEGNAPNTYGYDFTLKNGDFIPINRFSQKMGYQVVDAKDTILNDGIKRRCLMLEYLVYVIEEGEKVDSIIMGHDIWVEGIGSLKSGITMDDPMRAGSTTYTLKNVKIGNQCIYQKTTGNENPNTPVINNAYITPESPSVDDEVIFNVALGTFPGNVSYYQKLDSIVGRTIYVGSTFYGYSTVTMLPVTYDLSLGKLEEGEYTLIHTIKAMPTDIENTYTYNFNVKGANQIESIVKGEHLHANGSIILCTSPNAVKLDVYTMDAVKVGEASFINGEAVVKVNKTPATYLYIVTYPDGRRESGKVVVK